MIIIIFLILFLLIIYYFNCFHYFNHYNYFDFYNYLNYFHHSIRLINYISNDQFINQTETLAPLSAGGHFLNYKLAIHTQMYTRTKSLMEADTLPKNGAIGSTGVPIFGHTTLLWVKRGVPPQKKTLVKYFLKVNYEKLMTFQLLLNTHIKAFGNLLSYGSLEPPTPPPVHKGLSLEKRIFSKM